jgi:hypothetical protein
VTIISIHRRERLLLAKACEITILLALVASCPCAYGQPATQKADPRAVSTNPETTVAGEWPRVTLNVLVDRKGPGTVPAVGAAFQVLEDRTPQQSSVVSGPGTPVSLCIQVDISGSMQEHRDQIHDAAVALLNGLPPGSEVMVVFFAEKSFLALPFTPVSAVAPHVFENLKFAHRTALYDSIVITERYFVNFAHYPRRAFVLITDGHENASSHSYSDAWSSMLMPGSPFVYVLGIFDPYAPQVERNGQHLLASSNARIIEAPDGSQVLKRAGEICRYIDSQYALSYTSLSSRDKRLHKIEVKIPQAEIQVKVESLPGYYIPGT